MLEYLKVYISLGFMVIYNNRSPDTNEVNVHATQRPSKRKPGAHTADYINPVSRLIHILIYIIYSSIYIYIYI